MFFWDYVGLWGYRVLVQVSFCRNLFAGLGLQFRLGTAPLSNSWIIVIIWL